MSLLPDVILLNNNDNVVVCMKSMQAGEAITLHGQLVVLPITVGIGHKLASKNIQQGDIITKYGVPIGTATEAIAFGQHVHTHNMESNYIATYLIDN